MSPADEPTPVLHPAPASGIEPFDHVTLPQRVRFGTGSAAENIAAEVRERDPRAIMVIATPAEEDLARRLTAGVASRIVHTDVRPHVPRVQAEHARQVAASHDVDLLVSIGGGSTTGLAKAVALAGRQPIVAVPTTYAGSEATNVWGMTEDHTKTTGVDDVVLPRTVIYDASLFVTLPADLVVASGLNALAHGVDSLWAPRADPINRALAFEAAAALSEGLRAVRQDPQSITAHESCIHGAYLAAVAFASAGSGLHHKICHVLGGMYDLPHAQTHAAVLPHVLALNGRYVPAHATRLAAAIDGGTDTLTSLQKLYVAIGAPRALSDYGLSEEEIPTAVNAVLPLVPPSNPHPVSAQRLTRLIHDAWAGSIPQPAEDS